jgi:hypothetical protein
MAKSNKTLVAKTRLISRGGKIFTEVYHVDPDKEKNDKGYRKQYANAASTKVTERKYNGTVRQDHSTLKRGSLVTVPYQGEQVEAEFRHIAVTQRYPQGRAVVKLKSTGKLIERNVDEVTSTTVPEIKAEELYNRPTDAQAFALGDRVKFTLRGKDANGVTVGQDVYGTLTRFKGDPDARGQLVHIKLNDGTIKERYLHNVSRYEEKIESLSDTQVLAVNKAIDQLRNQNKGDFQLIKVYTGKRDSEAQISFLKTAINGRNAEIKRHLQVVRRELPFDDVMQKVLIGEQGEDERGRFKMTLLGKMYYKEVEKPEDVTPEPQPEPEPTPEPEVDPHVAAIGQYQVQLARAVEGIHTYASREDYPGQVQLYRAERIKQRLMRELIEYKNKADLPLTDEEFSFHNEPPAEPVPPVKPTVEEEEITSTPMTRTVTTLSRDVKQRKLSQSNDEKRQELEDLIAKTQKLNLSDETKDKILARYEEKLAKLGAAKIRAQRGANMKSILLDLEKIANGQVASGFRINERIIGMEAADEIKQKLRTKFSEAIKAGLAKRKAADKEYYKEVKKKTSFDDDDFEKAIIIEDNVFNSLARTGLLKIDNVFLLSRKMHAALTSMFGQVWENIEPFTICNSLGQRLHIFKVTTTTPSPLPGVEL